MNEELQKLLSSLTPQELLSLYFTSISDIEDPINYLPTNQVEDLVVRIQQALDTLTYPRFKSGEIKGSLDN